MAGQSAIVCLTRGYRDLSKYQPLIERNRSIFETINSKRMHHYPLVIWHEGNIDADQQRYILSRERNCDVRFVDVSETFRLAGSLRERDLVENWRLGYRLMCRFQSYHIWEYTRHFEYIMRIDEDCVLTRVNTDPIEALRRATGDFAAAAFVSETHGLTNRTLRPFVEQFARTEHLTIPNGAIYNHLFPYTNLYVTRTGFWHRPDVARFLSVVINHRDCMRFRWGDLPILGVALNLFAKPGKVGRLSRMIYTHESHNRTIAS